MATRARRPTAGWLLLAVGFAALTSCSSPSTTSADLTTSIVSATTAAPGTTVERGTTTSATAATPSTVARGAALSLSSSGFRLEPPAGWYATGNTIGFIGTMWTSLAWASTEPLPADPCYRTEDAGGVSEGCRAPVVNLPPGGLLAAFVQGNADMYVSAEDAATAVVRNGRTVVYRQRGFGCPDPALTQIGDAALYRSPAVIVDIVLCAPPDTVVDGRAMLDQLIDRTTFTT